ncbi:MAG: hypothetical protein ACP5RR_09390, partial [Candidatus Kapaibacteriota bacterium]
LASDWDKHQPCKFQSHYVRITTIPGRLQSHSNYYKFQSHYVRITTGIIVAAGFTPQLYLTHLC